MKKYCLLSLASLLAVGKLAYTVPSGPDSPAGWWPMGGAFLLFLAFILAAFMGGSALTRYSLESADAKIKIAVGLGFFALAGEFLGLLGGLGFFPSPWMSFVFVAPIFAFTLGREIEWAGKRFSLDLATTTSAIIFLFYFFLTWIPDSMPDPLWSALAAARAWTNHGAYASAPLNLAYFESGAWDALFLWGNFLLGSAPDGGLIAGQLFGQWLHLGAALLSALFLFECLGQFLPALSRTSRHWLVFSSVLGIAQIASVVVAKNDWGASLFLFAWFALWSKAKSAGEFFLAGLFLGLAFSTKASVVFSAAILCAAWAIGAPRLRPKGAQYVLLGAALAAAPWLLRNQLSVGNPFFPALHSIFGGVAGPSWEKFGLYYEGHRGMVNQFIWKDLGRDSPFVVMGFFSLVLIPLGGYFRRFRREWFFCLFCFLGAFLFWMKAGVKAEYRLFGPGCLLLIAASLGLPFSFFEGKKFSRALGPAGGILAVLYLSFAFHFPWRAPMQALAQPRPAEAIRSHFGGTVLAWIRLNLPPTERIASANEHRLYYLSDREAFRVWDRPELDRALYEAKNTAELLRALGKEGVRYLIFTRLDWDLLFRREALDALEAAWRKHPEATVFGNEHSALVDINALRGFYPVAGDR